MAARTKYDRNALLIQEVIRAQHIVIAGNLMVDMLNTRLRAGRHCQRMMYGVNPHQRDVPDAIAYTSVADLGPKLLVTYRIGGAEANVAETRDSYITGRKITSSAVCGTYDQFDVVTSRIPEIL